MSIDRFRGEYFFLSNMYVLAVPIQSEIGLFVPTVEHAYQSAKFRDPEVQYRVASLESGKETKRVAHELEDAGELIRPDWWVAREGIMLAFERSKFWANPDIADKLVGTGDEKLSEGNNWGDRFWGVDPPGSDNGLDRLGKILMQVREELRNG